MEFPFILCDAAVEGRKIFRPYEWGAEPPSYFLSSFLPSPLRHSCVPLSVISVFPPRSFLPSPLVIPAKAGIQTMKALNFDKHRAWGEP